MEKIIKTRSGRPKDAVKLDSIVKAAGLLFRKYGYTCTSMDAIADKSGVSKRTIYSHFQNKEKLFCHVIQIKINQYDFSNIHEFKKSDTLENSLKTLGTKILKLSLDQEVIEMYRMIISEAVNHPEIARQFQKNGPEAAKRYMYDFFKILIEQHELPIKDLEWTVELFSTMIQGNFLLDLLINLNDVVNKERIEAHVIKTIKVFLKLIQI